MTQPGRRQASRRQQRLSNQRAARRRFRRKSGFNPGATQRTVRISNLVKRLKRYRYSVQFSARLAARSLNQLQQQMQFGNPRRKLPWSGSDSIQSRRQLSIAGISSRQSSKPGHSTAGGTSITGRSAVFPNSQAIHPIPLSGNRRMRSLEKTSRGSSNGHFYKIFPS